ncbi:unnamed protein product [Paramecium sonneborni]|uniref:C-CAP/cofactor C-like domain-containing protein n=1 Tax=Paramecium sonneborni TaxID=65129 RepID=A0A8S1KZK1_9CILI|nr:unnamed protein product [Paramecium sonneborni]
MSTHQDLRALNIKQNIFEHFILPQKFNPQILNQMNTPYITFEQFKDLTCKQLSSIIDGEIIYTFFQLALENQPIIERKPVDVKQLSLFLQLQNFNYAGRHSIFENININDVKYQERQKQTMNSYSPLNSPRAKTMRVQSKQNDTQQSVQFVKQNIKDWINLISSNVDTITSQEFNLLSLIFASEQQNLSQLIFDGTQKLSKEIVSDWVQKTFNVLNFVLISFIIIASVIFGFTKSVTIKSNVGQDLKITQSEDSQIYIDCAVNTLSISQCTNCQINVASVHMITSITSCEKTIICVSSNYIKNSNTIDSIIHYYGSYPPIIYGDCRSIILASNNSNTEKTLQNLKDAQIPFNKSCRDKYQKPFIIGQNRIDWVIQSIDEFTKFILPEQHFGSIDASLIINSNFDIEKMAKEITEKKILTQPMNYEKIILPLLAPPEYIKAIFERYQLYAGIQAQIKQANLKDENSKLLQNAIQGNFREWLISTGSIKQISDLVKLIDSDQ